MSGITDDRRIREIRALITPNEVMGEFAATQAAVETVTAARDSRVIRVKVADLGKTSADCRSKIDRAVIGILVERLNLANTRLTSG